MEVASPWSVTAPPTPSVLRNTRHAAMSVGRRMIDQSRSEGNQGDRPPIEQTLMDISPTMRPVLMEEFILFEMDIGVRVASTARTHFTVQARCK